MFQFNKNSLDTSEFRSAMSGTTEKADKISALHYHQEFDLK